MFFFFFISGNTFVLNDDVFFYILHLFFYLPPGLLVRNMALHGGFDVKIQMGMIIVNTFKQRRTHTN